MRKSHPLRMSRRNDRKYLGSLKVFWVTEPIFVYFGILITWKNKYSVFKLLLVFCCLWINTFLNEEVASKALLAMMLTLGSSKIIVLCSRDCFSMLLPPSQVTFKLLLPPLCCPHCTDHHQSCHGLTSCSGFKKQAFHQEGHYSHSV